jgi:hypothetical protein
LGWWSSSSSRSRNTLWHTSRRLGFYRSVRICIVELFLLFLSPHKLRNFKHFVCGIVFLDRYWRIPCWSHSWVLYYLLLQSCLASSGSNH